MAMPSPASRSRRLCTSALVPTSMPRVGSSTMRMEGRRPSHLASTTFCWLPPDSIDTGSVSRPYLTLSRTAQSAAKLCSAEARMIPARRSVLSDASATFCWIDISMTRPCWRRSSGTRPIPAVMAAVGDALRSLCPPAVTAPASYRSIPKTARATSLRPAPTSPDRATISPARTSKDTSVNTPSRVSRCTVSRTSPGAPRSPGIRSGISRPTMARTRSPAVRPVSVLVSTCRPSRITVTVWQIANTSSSRCEMNSTAVPPARSALITSNSRATSTADSAAVGSSITMTRASSDRALAISTSCWSAMDSPRAMRPGSIRTPSRANSASASVVISRPSMRRPRRSGWRPMKMFSATDRSGNSVGSW